MPAESQQVCTICGVPVTWHQGRPLHVTDGRRDLMLREPRPHDATVDPRANDQRTRQA